MSDSPAPFTLAFLLALSGGIALLVTSCNPLNSTEEYISSAPADTNSTVVERYSGGSPQEIVYHTGDTTATGKLWSETLSPQGHLLKTYDYRSGDIKYYDDIHARFDSADGLRTFLQGMWRRTEPVTSMKEFESGRLARVISNRTRTFQGDTLIMTNYSAIYERNTGRKIAHDGLEVGFDVQYLDNAKVMVEEVLYRRRPDTSQVLSKTPILSPDLKGRVIDTLRVYGPNRFRIMSVASPNAEQLYERHKSLDQVSAELPDRMQTTRSDLR